MSDQEHKDQVNTSEDQHQMETGEERPDQEQPEQPEEQSETTEEGQADPAASPEDEFEVLRKEHADLKDKYLRLAAEFNNYKRRMVKEKMDMMNSAAQDTMSALLPVLDDFDRAHKAAQENDKGDLFAEGIGLVYKKLYSTLKQKGLEPMESEGKPFDPDFHEALTEIPAPSEDMKGKVVDIVEKGYLLNGKIIRHAKVVVGK